MSEDATWDDLAAGWDERDDVQRYAHLAYLSLPRYGVEQLDERCAHMLDYGAGTGALTRYLLQAGRRIVAVDTSAAMLAVLDGKQLDGVETVCADLCVDGEPELIYRRAPYALIVASSVCAFVADYPGLLRRFAGLLQPGGRLFQWDWEQPETEDIERPAFTHAQIAAAHESAALHTVAIETAFSLRVDDERWPVVMGVAERPADRDGS